MEMDKIYSAAEAHIQNSTNIVNEKLLKTIRKNLRLELGICLFFISSPLSTFSYVIFLAPLQFLLYLSR